MKTILIVLALFTMGFRARADVLAQYDFTGSVRTSSDTDLNSSATAFSDGPGLIGTIDTTRGNPLPSLSVDISTTASTQVLAVSGNDYFTFTLTPAGGFALNLTSLTFDSAIFGNITATFFVRSSADNFVSDLGITTTTLTGFTGTNISLTGSAFQNVTAPLTFRVYVFDTADNGNRGDLLDNIIINGSVVLIPEPSTGITFATGTGFLLCWQRFRRKKS